jgi:hypothetical protein
MGVSAPQADARKNAWHRADRCRECQDDATTQRVGAKPSEVKQGERLSRESEEDDGT